MQKCSALKKLRVERDAVAAMAKNLKDRETAALVRGHQAAWKVRSKQLKAQKAAQFKREARAKSAAKMELAEERDLEVEREKCEPTSRPNVTRHTYDAYWATAATTMPRHDKSPNTAPYRHRSGTSTYNRRT